MKKTLVLMLSAVLMLSVFSGCAIQKNIYKDNPQLAEQILHPEENTAPIDSAVLHSFAEAYKTYAPDKVVATVDGIDVTWQEYFYNCTMAISQIEAYSGPITDFNADLSGQTYSDIVREMVEGQCTQYRSVDYNAGKEGIVLSDESVAAIEEQLQAEIANASPDGTEEGFNNFLETNYLSRDIYNYLVRVSMLYSDGFNYYCGENGEKITDEETITYAENEGYMSAKHILLKTIDDSQNPISDEEKAKKLEQAKQLISRISNGENFDTLMSEYNEDPGAADYPDGYCFKEGQFVSEFENAVKELKPGELTKEPVESLYGYHVILRTEIKPDSIITGQSDSATLRQAAASDRYNKIVKSWIDASEFKYVDGFSIDFNEVF